MGQCFGSGYKQNEEGRRRFPRRHPSSYFIFLKERRSLFSTNITRGDGAGSKNLKKIEKYPQKKAKNTKFDADCADFAENRRLFLGGVWGIVNHGFHAPQEFSCGKFKRLRGLPRKPRLRKASRYAPWLIIHVVISWKFGFILVSHYLAMNMAVWLMVIDTQDSRAVGKRTFSVFSRSFLRFTHCYSYR